MRGCTIIASNYLPFARVLAASFRRAHPGAEFFVLAVDDPDGAWLSDEADFTVVRPVDLGLTRDEIHRMAAIYDVTELSTALKPWLLEHLVRATDDAVLYLDPDIEVYLPLTELADLSTSHGIVVTPHLLTPLPLDGLQPDDKHMMGSGIYNLGFIGVGPAVLASDFFSFWKSRLRRHAIVDVANHLFTDQRWLDWVDCFDHAVCRDPGVNVAYWNVWSRLLSDVGGTLHAGGQPLRFFHFSGFDPRQPTLLSRHQGERPRVRPGQQPLLDALCQRYAETVLAATDPEVARAPYGWARSGTIRLSPGMRRTYRTALLAAEEGGTPLPPNPFDDPAAFAHWLSLPAVDGGVVPRFVHGEAVRDPGVLALFPDPLGASQHALMAWLPTHEDFKGRLAPSLLRASPVMGPPSGHLPGINVAGYLSAELGVGAVGRSVLAGARAVGLPASTFDCHEVGSRLLHPFAGPRPYGTQPYDVNVLCANADDTKHMLDALGPQTAVGRRTVAIWHWEAERLPESMRTAWNDVDEVWTTSRFTYDALATDASKPLHLFPMPIVVPRSPHTTLTRDDLGLPEGFLVLFCFDWYSVLERKNPTALIDAFTSAFREDDGAHLYIKSINGVAYPEELEALKHHTSRRDVHVVDEYLPVTATRALMALADCYASLHRSEGFGLTMAEAMSLARPVVATGWSGNLDFMDDRVAHLVPAELVPIRPDVPVYGGIGCWADPDVDAAARALRAVHADPVAAAAMGARAREHLLATRSPERAGAFLLERTALLRGEAA
jgi:glycosyltransferase involved in cell wall biosynthesis